MVSQITLDDFVDIDRWFVGHHVSIDFNDLPPLGFRNEIAALFIVETSANFCMFEPLVADPLANRHFRSEAIDELVDFCILKAKSLSYDYIWAYCIGTGSLRRSLKHGFVLNETQGVMTRKDLV